MAQFSLSKHERLHKKSDIEKLFNVGDSLVAYPLRITFAFVNPENGIAVSAMFAVSKRRFKHANSRNRLKRRMREAFRLNKKAFTGIRSDYKLLIAFQFIGKEELPFDRIQSAMLKEAKKISAAHA